MADQVQFEMSEEDTLALLAYESAFDILAARLNKHIGLTGTAVQMARHMTPAALNRRFTTILYNDELAVYKSDELVALSQSANIPITELLGNIRPVFTANYVYICSVDTGEVNTLYWPWHALGDDDSHKEIREAIFNMPAHIKNVVRDGCIVQSRNIMLLNIIVAHTFTSMSGDCVWLPAGNDAADNVKNYFILRNVKWTDRQLLDAPAVTDDIETVINVGQNQEDIQHV